MVGPVAKREAVAHLQAVMGLSERRACGIVGADRKMVRYRSCRPPDTELRGHLRELANARRRFGYRRLFVLLRQQGEPSGRNRIYRLYREEGLSDWRLIFGSTFTANRLTSGRASTAWRPWSSSRWGWIRSSARCSRSAIVAAPDQAADL
ncbi:hypothetical protein ABIB95_009615 [Bradyrhizobium sp. LA2.1]